MILLKSLIISTLCLFGLIFFVKISLDRDLLLFDRSEAKFSIRESKLENQNVYSDKNLTINRILDDNLSYLDIIFEKGKLKLLPDYIPFVYEGHLKIQNNSKILKLESTKLSLFMLLDSEIYRVSFNMLKKNYLYFFWIIFSILLLSKAIFFINFYFRFSNLVISICLLVSILLIAQHVDSINNFRVLEINSKVGDRLDSTLIRNSILAIPAEKTNYSFLLKSKIKNIPYSAENVILFSHVAGSENFIYVNQSNLYAQQSLLNNLNKPMPYKQEISSIYSPGISSSSNLEYKIKNSNFVTLKLNTEVGGKRGFYFPVLRNQIVFPKVNQDLISQFEYTLQVNTKLESLNFIKNILLLFCVILMIYIMRLIKNEK